MSDPINQTSFSYVAATNLEDLSLPLPSTSKTSTETPTDEKVNGVYHNTMKEDIKKKLEDLEEKKGEFGDKKIEHKQIDGLENKKNFNPFSAIWKTASKVKRRITNLFSPARSAGESGVPDSKLDSEKRMKEPDSDLSSNSSISDDDDDDDDDTSFTQSPQEEVVSEKGPEAPGEGTGKPEVLPEETVKIENPAPEINVTETADPDAVEHDLTPEKIQEIEKLKEELKNDPSNSTQAILSKMLEKLEGIYGKGKVTIDSKLKKSANDNFITESFKPPPKPGEEDLGIEILYYKVGVNYTFKVNNSPIKDVNLDREIFTNATTPGKAILVATKFAENVIQIAEASQDGKKMVQNEHYNESMLKLRGFKFNYNIDPSGRPTSLNSISGIGENKKSIEIAIKSEAKSDKVYLKEGKSETREVSREDEAYKNRKLGTTVYESEEQRLLNASYEIKSDENYNPNANEILKQIERIKKEIEENEKEFNEAKTQFFETNPLFKLFSGAEKKGFAQLLAIKDYENHPEGLSTNMKIFLELKGRKEKLDCNVPKSIQQNIDIEERMNKLKEEIAQEQAPYNQKLVRLQELNQELANHKEELKVLLEKAKTIVSNSTQSDKKIVKDAKEAIDKINLKKLEERIEANDKTINEIVNKLKEVGADQVDKALEIKAFEPSDAAVQASAALKVPPPINNSEPPPRLDDNPPPPPPPIN